MKKLLIMLMAAGGSAATFAQTTPAVKTYATDADLSRWVIDLNLKGGIAGQDFTTPPSAANYPNALNMNTGTLDFRNGYSFGGDAGVGFFFGKKRHFGIGAAVMYMSQHGDASLDNYHVEYQATDANGNIFRQLVTGNVKEAITSSIVNVPLVLKYKNRFSKHWGFAADAGALVNLQMRNAYISSSSFDNEAIYQFAQSSEGGKTSVYDNSATPSANDWFITKAEFLKNNPGGNYTDYINAKRALGFNVGQGLTPNSNTGKVSYNSTSIGLILKPSVNYFLSDKVALDFGLYYMFQPYKNDIQPNYRLTDGTGGYSSVLNNVTKARDEAYGVNLGVRFFLGKKRAPLAITSIDQFAPSQCGLCDGGMAIHGLSPDQPVTVAYSVNGAQPTKYDATVLPDGQVKIANLCAGTYTGIVATIKRRSAEGKPVTLTAPVLSISSQNPSNPTVQGTCDGSVKFNGLYAGKSVTINYNLNGSPQAAFTGIAAGDNSVTINGLCEGKYTGIVATCNTCTAPGNDFTLAAPIPPPPPPPVVAVEETPSATVLFKFDKSEIRPAYYPMLDKAISEMREDQDIYIRVDGHTDAIGTINYNIKLSARRAMAVKKYFIKKGIKASHIKMYADGKTQPEESNKTREGRRENRCVILITQSK